MTDEERKGLAAAKDAAERGDWKPLRALGYRNYREMSDEELRRRAEGDAPDHDDAA